MTTSQPVVKYDLDRDVRTVEAMAARLTPYIYEEELYGQMPGDLPRLTLGGLLLRLHRLSVLGAQHLLLSQQEAALKTATEQFNRLRKEWAVAYEGKILRELQARLRALDQFLYECAESPHGCADNYPSGIEKRVIVEALKDEAAASNTLTDDLRSAIANIDGRLRRYTRPGNFIWDSRLEAAYPRDKYPFLYVTATG